MTSAIASVIFILCQIIKALRIYFVLGEYRIKLIFIFIFSNIGIFISYMIDGGLVFIYEIVIIIPFFVIFKLPLFSSFYTLIILRLFDSILLSISIILLGIDVPNKFYLLICVLTVTLWLMVSTFPIIAKRLEKRILISDFPPKVSLAILRQLVTLKKQIGLLSFTRSGSIPMIIMLTCLIWGLECLALALLNGDFWVGTNAVFSRIAKSCGITTIGHFEEYNILVYAILFATAITASYAFYKYYFRGYNK